MLGLAVGILATVVFTLGIVAKIMVGSGREFNAPERVSSPRKYW